MTTRQRNLLVLLVVLGGAVAAFLFMQPKSTPDAELLSAVPRDSWLVATLDLRPLADSPVAAPLASGGLTDVLGAGKVQELCGFDPLSRVRGAALAVPEGGEKQSWGLAFVGDIKSAELATCARKMIDARGGSAKVTTRGVFTVIEDEASTATPPPRIAIRDGGPLLAGQGGWLDTMIEASLGRVPRVTESAEHMKLRQAIAARSKGGRAPALVVTAVLPRAMRDRLKEEMGVEIADAGAGGSGAAANAMMAGVLGVDTAGLSVVAGASGEDSVAELDLTCESAAACGEVKLFLEKQRLRFSQSFVVRMLGLGPLIDSLAVSTDAATCTAQAREPSDALASALDRALKSSKSSPPPPPPRPTATGAPPPAAPADAAGGEILHPARSDAGTRH